MEKFEIATSPEHSHCVAHGRREGRAGGLAALLAHLFFSVSVCVFITGEVSARFFVAFGVRHSLNRPLSLEVIITFRARAFYTRVERVQQLA